MTILYFILGLGLLIFIHELGHFLVAKANGIRVERFSLGFGPRIIKFKIGETEYCVSLLPLGGYVKMTGQEDLPKEEEIVPLDDPKAFSSKSLSARLSVVLAGPVMNLILPFILMPLVFILGRVEPQYLQEPPEVLGVLAASPAQEIGLKKGDQILSINGEEVTTWTQVLRESAKPAGYEISLKVKRGETIFDKKLNLAEGEKGGPGLIGVEPIFFVDLDPVIDEVVPASPAQEAGLKSGDRIVAINGQVIKDWRDMSKQVNASQGKVLEFKVQRGEEKLNFSLAPDFNESLSKYVIGVSKASDPDLYQLHRYPFVEALRKGVSENVMLFGMTFKVLKDLFTLKASYKELGGPIRIAQISAKAAERGIGNFFYLLAFLSIQLGILNLLPIPVLDGGHVVFMAYEGIVRKPLSPRKRLIFQQVGMVLLLTLMVLVTVNDIDAIWGFGDLLDKVKGLFG